MLRRVPIKSRVLAQVLVFAVGLLIVSVLSMLNMRDALHAEKASNTRFLIETVHSLIGGYHKQYLSGEITLDEAKELAILSIESMRYDNGNYFWINDKEPKLIFNPGARSLNGKNVNDFQDVNGVYIFREMLDRVAEKGEGLVSYVWNKPNSKKVAPKISYVKEFKPWGWIIGSGVYTDDIKEESHSAMIGPFIVAISVLVLCISIGFVISRSILTPLDETAQALNNISQGDGDLTLRLSESGSDEITRLSRSFNIFVGKLERSILGLTKSGHSLENSTNKINQVIVQTRTSSEQQERETQSIASAITQMSATVNEVAKDAELTAERTSEANDQLGKSTASLRSTVEFVNEVASEGKKTSNVIVELNESTQNISSVLEVIRGIAEQTNLLALNAAIEAARAGEQGRGFAVVADEVRNLAAKTQASTEEIRTMIEGLQHSSTYAVSAIDANQEKIEEAVYRAEEGSRLLDLAAQSIDAIASMNTQIASATEQQSYTAEEIHRGISRIATLSESLASETEVTVGESKKLFSVSRNVSETLSQFKIDA